MPEQYEQEVPEELKQEVEYLVKQIQEAKMPEWWLKMAKQIADTLQVHTKGRMFDKITGLYPNEHPDSQKHCVRSFEPITQASIWKAINNIVRVFNNSSYNIQLSDKTKEVIEDYQENEGSFFSQFLEDWIRYAIAEDPNGICVWYPLGYTDYLYRYVCYNDLISVTDDVLIFRSEYESKLKKELKDVEYTKETFIDYSYEIQPGIPVVNSTHGVMKTFNSQLEVTYINPVFHVFTKTHFIRFYKDNPGDKEFKYDYYKHPKEMETLPYFENGGIEVEKDLYTSFIQPFIPFGNLSLIAHRNQRAVELMHYYPKMSEVQQECDVCKGSGYHDGRKELGTCKSCKGSKYVTFQSPYKVYRKMQDSFDADNKVFSTPSVEYYSPPADGLKLVNEQWKDYLAMAEMAVFVQQKVETGNVEAAKSKEIDREELYAWLANISKVLYNNLQMGLQYLENYVNPNPIQVSIEKPYSFAILTESEAFEALSAMLSSSVPVAIKANQIDNFVNKFISESSPVKRALQILKKYDLLLYYSTNDVGNLKGNGFVDQKMCQKHTLAYPILMQMYELNNNLFEMEDEAIITKLETEITKYDLTKDLKTSVLNVA